MITVQYGNYTFPLSPSVTVSTAPVDGLQRPTAYKKTVKLTGELFSQGWAITPELLATERQALETAFKESRDLRIMNWQPPSAPVLLDALWSTTAIAGVSLEGPISFPPSDGSEYATHLAFELTVSAEYTAANVDIMAQIPGSLSPPTPPTHNVYGEYTLSEDLSEGAKLLNVTGKLRGSSKAMIETEVLAIVAALGANMQLVGRSVEYRYAAPGAGGGFKTDAQFTIQAVDLANSRSVYDWQETIEFVEAYRPVIVRPVLGGYDAVFQEGPKMPCRVVQSGSAKGRTNYPAWPPRRFVAIKAVADELTKESPIIGPDGTTQAYPIRWKYTGIAANNIGQGFAPGPLLIIPTPGSTPV